MADEKIVRPISRHRSSNRVASMKCSTPSKFKKRDLESEYQMVADVAGGRRRAAHRACNSCGDLSQSRKD